MPRRLALGDLGRTAGEGDLGGDEAPLITSGPTGPRTRYPQRPSGPQACDGLAGQRSPALDVERLVDRLVRDPHGRIVGELVPQPGRDLLRTPRLSPPSIGAAGAIAAGERHRRTGHRDTLLGEQSTGQAFLHVPA